MDISLGHQICIGFLVFFIMLLVSTRHAYLAWGDNVAFILIVVAATGIMFTTAAFALVGSSDDTILRDRVFLNIRKPGCRVVLSELWNKANYIVIRQVTCPDGKIYMYINEAEISVNVEVKGE